MSRLGAMNLAGVLGALALSVFVAGGPRERRAMEAREAGAQLELVDATGQRVSGGARARIASGSTVADRLLLELCDPTQVIAFTAASQSGPAGHRFGGRPTIETIDDVEAVVALRPDLVLVHNVADQRRVERLREAGLTVFDLGPLRGRETLFDDARQVAALCGAPERGERYARSLERRLDAIARHVPAARRPRAMYLSLYGDRFFGGAEGTSYHDVLLAAGLRDAASERYDGWPQYTVEQILGLDPELIVTRAGMRAAVCDHPVLSRLRACHGGRVVELDGGLLDAPGPAMVEAAEALYDAVHRDP